jgi:hypothetical protein
VPVERIAYTVRSIGHLGGTVNTRDCFVLQGKADAREKIAANAAGRETPVLKITATVTGTDTQAIARLREKRRVDGVVAMTQDEHTDLLELEREQVELSHARWAATRVVAFLRDVVDDGGQFIRGGNGFVHAACVPTGEPRLDAAVRLAADETWLEAQFNTLRVKPRHMAAARAHMVTLMEKLIVREVANGQ